MDTDRGQMVPESCHQGWSSIRSPDREL